MTLPKFYTSSVTEWKVINIFEFWTKNSKVQFENDQCPQAGFKQLNKTKDVNTEFAWKTHQRSRLWKRREKDYSNRHLKNEKVNKLLIINILNQEKVSIGEKGSEDLEKSTQWTHRRKFTKSGELYEHLST